MESKRTEALKFADEALTQLEVGEEPLARIVLRSVRVARLSGQTNAEGWLSHELRGYGEGGDERWEYASWSGRESKKNADGTQLYWTAAIELIETELALALEEFKSSRIEAPVPDSTKNVLLEMRGTATERVIADLEKTRSARLIEIRRWTQVVSALRGAIHGWLTRTVINLRYGAIVDDVFERTRERFDRLLATKAPDAARALSAAYARSGSDDPEDWSQALGSCRRALKALADVLYPPTKEQPAGRELGGEQYKNRLVQYAAENLNSKSQEGLFIAEIEMVAHRADALNDLANKGVHSEINYRDLELTVVHTYLLAGELLGLTDEADSGATAEQAD